MSKMCDHKGKWNLWHTLFGTEPKSKFGPTEYGDEGMTQFSKSKRVKCPKCGRRVWAELRAAHDGTVIWRVPPHKRRMWWKKTRRK